MDQTHTLQENLDKVQSLIDAVVKLQKTSNDLTFSALLFQLDSLKALSEETNKSLQTVRKMLLPNA